MFSLRLAIGFIMISFSFFFLPEWDVNNVYFASWGFEFLVFLYICVVIFDGFLSELLIQKCF